MNVLPVIKIVSGLASSVGAGTVVGNVIKATTPVGIGTTQKVLVGLGGVILSSIAGDAAAAYIERQIDTMTQSWRVGKRAGEAMADGKSFFDAAEEALDEEFPDASTTN